MNIFALNSNRNFAELIAKELNIPLSEHQEIDFEDGEHKSRPLVNVRNQDVFVIQSLYGDEQKTVNDKLCRLLFFIGALKDASAKNITAIVPYLCYARKDRKTKSRDPVTTRYLACLFEAVGVDRVVTIDVHNLQAYQNAFRCNTENLEARKLFADYFVPLVGKDEIVIMSPDFGGIKRAEKFQQILNKRLKKEFPVAFMEKYRSEGNVWGEMVSGEVKDKTVIIIDDLVSSGTTLARSSAACKRMGAKKVFAVVTHGVFTSKADIALQEESLEQIVITNSIPLFRLKNPKVLEKIKVLDIAPLFAETIKRLNNGGSIVELLEE
ncbi:MAG: ribose-phosphate pyrophosphokinase [Bacteroidetes bacterium RIFCSPLOWO2_12_FULL_35_15]|nr:MAG: ribose-phosphate pyrophosphokinase [Bacteroidetes bacterium RIFCSPLOWO2_12_FULL_35_15]